MKLRLCLWCDQWKPEDEMRSGPKGLEGRPTSICRGCRDGNPGLSWCKFHGEAHPIERFHCQGGKPELICMAAAYQVYEKPSLQTCVVCGETKTNAEMKGKSGVRGSPPPFCHDCQVNSPDLRWCTFHEELHPRVDFDANRADRPTGICRMARHESRYPNLPPIQCVACREKRPPGAFRGWGDVKMLTCKPCNAAHPGRKWCRDCSDWREAGLFPTGNSGARCSACLLAYKHGTTVAEILRIQGSETPECAACGSVKWLCVDHDHTCCPGFRSRSCGKCVRGYLCHDCNTSEGLLRTSERAFALAQHMLRNEQKAAQLAS